jgi:hypothetical protein
MHLFDEETPSAEQLLLNEHRCRCLIEYVGAAPTAAVSRANGFEMFNDWVEPTQIMEAGGRFAAKSPRTAVKNDHPI